MRSTWQLNLEAFRFYRLKSENFVKLSLLLILALQILARVAPVGDRNFYAFTSALDNLGKLNVAEIMSRLSPGNWVIICLHLLSILLASFLALIYTQVFILEQTCYCDPDKKSEEDKALSDKIRAFRVQVKVLRTLSQSLNKDWTDRHNNGQTPVEGGYFWDFPSSQGTSDQDAGVREELPADQPLDLESLARTEDFPACPEQNPQQNTALALAFRRFGQTLPRQLVFLLILDLAYGFSILLLGLPFYFYVSAFLLAPFLFMQGLSFSAGMRKSYQETKGLKLFIISNYFVVNLIFLLVEGLATLIFANSYYSLGLWQSLIFTLRFLVFARFTGLMYLVISDSKQVTMADMTKL